MWCQGSNEWIVHQSQNTTNQPHLWVYYVVKGKIGVRWGQPICPVLAGVYFTSPSWGWAVYTVSWQPGPSPHFLSLDTNSLTANNHSLGCQVSDPLPSSHWSNQVMMASHWRRLGTQAESPSLILQQLFASFSSLKTYILFLSGFIIVYLFIQSQIVVLFSFILCPSKMYILGPMNNKTRNTRWHIN